MTSTQTPMDVWTSFFGPVLPVAHVARGPLIDRWLRIHNLPLSKRYPETEGERQEVLKRQNAVAQYALGEGTECILFTTAYGDGPRWSDHSVPAGSRYSGEFQWLDNFPQQHVGAFKDWDDEIQIFASRHHWKIGNFDQFILMCARGIARPCVFASAVAARAYAPYDGGADLFFPSASDVNDAREQFGEWLSTTPSGL